MHLDFVGKHKKKKKGIEWVKLGGFVSLANWPR